MWVHGVDPRDTRWEVLHPAYRVYFWQQPHPENPHSIWISDEWEIGDADVDEVLNWLGTTPPEGGLWSMCASTPFGPASRGWCGFLEPTHSASYQRT